MSRTLGLDIGPTSIGWCLMEDKHRIVKTGVRIFPVGVQEDKWNKSSVEESKNAARRTARGIRRGYDRYRHRRKELRKTLLSLGMLPHTLEVPSARHLYGLRRRGLDEQLTLEEFGRVILHLNQRRGFKSNRKTDVKAGDKQRSEIKLQMNALREKVRELGFRTLGEYLFSLYEANYKIPNWHNPDEPVERIRKRFVYRSMYVEEFDALWAKQAEYYPDILSDENKTRVRDRCLYYQRPLRSQKHLVARCRFEPKKRVAPRSSLAFQEFRIWESLSRIRVTDSKRLAVPLSLDEKRKLYAVLSVTEGIKLAGIRKVLKLPKFVIFNDLPDPLKGNTTAARIIAVLGEERWSSMQQAERERVWHVLYFFSSDEKLAAWAERELDLDEETAEAFASIALEEEYGSLSHKAIHTLLPHLQEGLSYADACKAVNWHHSYDAENEDRDRILDDRIKRGGRSDTISELRNPLVVRAVSETATLVNAIIQEFGRPDQIRIEFARGMKQKKDTREQIRKSALDKERRRVEYREFLRDRLGWHDVSRSQLLKFELWLEMEFAENDLRSLDANMDVADFRRFCANVKPTDRTKFRLWLECGRRSVYSGDVISLQRLFSGDIHIEHIVPYSRSMDNSFSNLTLSEQAFNDAKGNLTPYEFFKDRPSEFEAFKDRVKALPQRREGFLSTKQKKLLQQGVEQDFRPGMIESTAYIAKEVRNVMMRVCRDVRVTGGEATSVLRRVWGLSSILNPDKKNEKSRNDHRHHAVDAFVIANTNDWWINLLSQASQFDSDGKQHLDRLWRTPAGRDLLEAAGGGLPIDDDPLGLQQYVNPATGEIISDRIPGPYIAYRNDLEQSLSTLFVSYRADKRLKSSRQNKYVRSRSAIQKPQRSIAIRGALHGESLYGQIENPHTGKQSYVMRKALSTFDKMKQVEQIVDPAIREIVRDHIERNGGASNIKEALKKEVWMHSKDGKKRIRINKVRIVNPAKELIQPRPRENHKLFVESSENYGIAIYEDPETRKRDVLPVSFFKAVENHLAGTPVFDQSRSGLPLRHTLCKRDLVILYERSADEIDWNNASELSSRLHRVRKMSGEPGKIDLFLDGHLWSQIEDDERDKYKRIRSVSDLNFVKVRVSPTGILQPVYD